MPLSINGDRLLSAITRFISASFAFELPSVATGLLAPLVSCGEP